MLAQFKFIEYDEEHYQLKGFNNIYLKNELPEKYLKGEPCFYIINPRPNLVFLKVRNNECLFLTKDVLIPKNYFLELTTILKRAGQRLADIKHELQ